MSPRKPTRKRASSPLLREFIAALAQHEAREFARDAKREKAAQKSLEEWTERLFERIDKAVAKVARYEWDVAKGYSLVRQDQEKHGATLSEHDLKLGDHETRIKALEKKTERAA